MSDLAGTGGYDIERPDDQALEGQVQEPRQQGWKQGSLIRVVQSAHRGPMPSPETLAEYDQVVPGLAREIVDMAKDEQKHRHAMETVLVHGDRDAVVRGQRFGLAALVLLLAMAGYMVYKGSPGPAAWLLSATVVGVVGVFVTGRILESRQTAPDPETGPDEEPPSTA